MNKVSLVFYGLCGVKKCSDRVTIYMPGQAAHDVDHADAAHNTDMSRTLHECTLSVRMRHVDLDELGWQPDMVTTDAENEQVGTWRVSAGSRLLVRGNELTAGEATGDSPPALLKLNCLPEHGGIETLEADHLPPCTSIATLYKGLLTTEITRKVCVVQNGTRPGAEMDIANSVKWSTSATQEAPVVLASSAGWLQLRTVEGEDGKTYDAVVSVTNIARVRHPKGLEHFSQYYSLVTRPNKPAGLLDCAPRNKRDYPVWDCVPPVGLP